MAWHDPSATSAYSPGVGAAPLPPNGSGMSTATVRSPTRASTAKSLSSSPCAATCRPAAAGLSVSASAVASIFDFSSVVMVPPWGCRLQGASASTVPETFLGLRGNHDDEVDPDEHLDHTDLDGLGGLDVSGSLVDDEHHVVVDLELGTLVGFDGVLDRELVQLELSPHGVELLLGRLVEADPYEGVLGVACGRELVERQVARPAPPVLIESAVDDHGLIVAPALLARCESSAWSARRRPGQSARPRRRASTRL